MTTAEFVLEREWESNRESAAKWVFSHAFRHKLAILGMLLGALGNALLASAQPLLTGQAFDAIVQATPDLGALGRAALLVGVTQIVRGLLLQLLRNLSAETLGQRIERDIRDELYIALIGKSMAFHDAYPTGDLMARATNDVREINFMFNPGLNLVIGSANFVIMPLFVAPSIHPQLIVAPIVYLLFYGYVIFSYLRELRPASEAVRRNFGEMNTRLAEAIEGIETVKGTAQEAHEMSRFRRAVTAWREAFVWDRDIQAKFLPRLLLAFLIAGGTLHALLLFRAGVLQVGDVVAYSGILMLFGFPTWTGQFAYPRVASGLASARRLLELIKARSELGENAEGHDALIRGEVVFDDVSFCYQPPEEGCRIDEEAVALEHISFSVSPGKTVAIVGQTGSGKSTLAKLINRTYDVDEGRILVDGVDVRDWSLAALRRQISIIEQDVFLFSRTVAENIAFGYQEATQEQIEAAAKAAQAHDFILDFADGYETVVGERGTTLSGGQRQRIALARAFLTDPGILIMDDATSAIDSATEDRIQRAIERAAENRTTFLITHRLSQIRWADLIVVMRQGRVDAIGSHEELLRTSSAYRDIFARYD
ncbi:MAG: ABC transporter ATP-binding protein [Anaerolineae bacterium]|nr:ABC transporter ATP-binding protein [Anaerolineae bacterium]